jgi:hypothetical protein
LIERLLTVDPAASERIGTSNPFPAGTLLNTLIQDGDLLTVDLGGELTLPGDPARWRQIHALLGHSLLQFPGVARLRVTVNEQLPPGYPEEGRVPDPAVVASPEEPKLIGVVGIWEPGKGLQEVSVFFDRPLEVKHIELLEHGAGQVAGERFRSVFDMAVVVLPAHPEDLEEGEPMTIKYDVVDRLGRAAQGEKTLPLSRMEHP